MFSVSLELSTSSCFSAGFSTGEELFVSCLRLLLAPFLGDFRLLLWRRSLLRCLLSLAKSCSSCDTGSHSACFGELGTTCTSKATIRVKTWRYYDFCSDIVIILAARTCNGQLVFPLGHSARSPSVTQRVSFRFLQHRFGKHCSSSILSL